MNRYADKFVVGAMLTPAALAEYNIASQEIPLVAVLPYAVGTVLITRYVRLVKEERRQELLELWVPGDPQDVPLRGARHGAAHRHRPRRRSP